MNQISNQGQQQPGQHSVQPQQLPHQVRYQYPGPPQQFHNAGVGYNGGYQPSMMYTNQVVNHATLTLPQNTNISTSTASNGMTMVDVAPPPPAYSDNQSYVHMVPQYQYMPYGPPQHYQPIVPQPAPKPIVQREKRILSFVDPSTNATVNLPQKEQKLDTSTASSPFEPNKQDTKPHTPVNEVKDAPPETEDINSAFGRAVANRAVSAKALAGPPHEEEHVAQKEQKFDIASPPFEPNKQDTKPHISVNEVTDAAPETEDINLAFARSVADRAVSAKPSAAQPHEEEHVVITVTPETPQKLDRPSLIRDYENKIDEFVSVPENLADIQNKVYSRKLVQLLREIIKNFHTVPCPISEQELKRIGIDRTTMPSPANVSHKSKYGGGRDNFNPDWAKNAQQNIRRPYNTRPSKNNDGQNKPNKNNPNRQPIVPRVSIQRKTPQTMTRGENAWKPDVLNAGSNVDVSSVEARIAKTKKEVRGLLNKITPTTYGDLSVEMINKGVWGDEDTLPTVVELIFIKAVEEPTFVALYSDLCQVLHKAEQNSVTGGTVSKPKFHGAIIRKCQSSFEKTALSQFQETIISIQEELKEEEKKEERDEKKIADLNDRLEDMSVKEKRRMLGTIKFISHLFRISLLNYKIIENCIVILIRNAEQASENNEKELMTEYAVDLMKHVGPHVIQRKEDTTKLDGYVGYLDKFKPVVSNRVKFMIVDLVELRDKKWVQKGEGPKTKKQVEMDVMKEEEQNKIERDVYEKTAADTANRKRSNVMDKQQPRYASRPSMDNKKDRVNAAVAASNNVAGSSLKKDTSLLKHEQQPARLGTTKKNWGAGQNSNTDANSATPSQNNKTQRVIARQSADARNNDPRKSTAQKDNKPSAAPTPKVDSRSASTTPPPAVPSSSRSQNNTPTVTPEDQFNKTAFKSGFEERLQSHLDGTDTDEVVKSLVEFNTELNNPVIFFEQMFKYCCEHLKLKEEKERHAVSTLVVKCYNNSILKNAFAPAFKKYCKYLVEEDVEGDLPHLRTIFPEFVARIMTASNMVPSHEFVEGFKEFHENGNSMFAGTLAEFGRILKSRNEEVTGPLLWLFNEFASADEHYKSDEMQKIFARQSIDFDENHKNLNELVTPD